jgi:hypothetical protein
MKSILHEYLMKGYGLIDLERELQRLIAAYNTYTGSNMFVYAADSNKARSREIDVSLIQDDFYAIQDLLRLAKFDTIDFYIETPGGSGEAAEEVAKFLRNKFKVVNFVIGAEAKSAGTILALSGDHIYMTETGSLGPIDAQVRIGRTVVSAHDYKEWVEQKQHEVNQVGKLNPLDAVIVAQISPGELYGVINSLEFAKDLVKIWLEKYKFKDWIITQNKKIVVTPEMRKKRANEVAEMLCNHTMWRTHGRSLKIDDLKDMLLIGRIDDDPKLSEIVHRINTIVRLIFDSSTVYKLFFLSDIKLSKTFHVNADSNFQNPQEVSNHGNSLKNAQNVAIEFQCPKCAKKYHIEAQLLNGLKPKNYQINSSVQKREILVCTECGFAIDLKPIKNKIESETGKKVLF